MTKAEKRSAEVIGNLLDCPRMVWNEKIVMPIDKVVKKVRKKHGN